MTVRKFPTTVNSKTLDLGLLLLLTVSIVIEYPTVSNAEKSYKLIVYLDYASEVNAINDNFKIVIYDSQYKEILSAIPQIDFTDKHQKISPKDGFTITDKEGQHPNLITVCAQQKYAGEYIHNDCYDIEQNIAKTYWYTTFDYGTIDGFEGECPPGSGISCG